MGDGLLAIFPLSQPSACPNLLHAVTEARQAMAALNEKNGETGRAPLKYGIGVHVGDVMYGNIGSRTRLDFTVIGPAVNMASRLEATRVFVGMLKPERLHRLTGENVVPIIRLRSTNDFQHALQSEVVIDHDRRGFPVTVAGFLRPHPQALMPEYPLRTAVG
jgi:class 3 adenylate cyclase